MLKKILTLCLALIMLSSLALASPVAIDAQAAYTQLSVGDNTAAITDEVLGGDVALILEAEEATDAIVISAVYADEQFVTAAVSEEKSIVVGDNELTVSLPAVEVGESCEVKFFVWEKATLEPLAQPVAIEVVPKAAETVTYTLYASEDGEDRVSSTNQAKYAANYSWTSTSVNPANRETSGAKALLGYRQKSQPYCAMYLRFPLPELADGEVVKSAKLVAKIQAMTNVTSDIDVHAYAYSPAGVAFGDAFALTNFGSFADITANDIGNTVLPTTAVAGDTIEIDITQYVQSGSGNADIFIAAPNLTSQNYLYLHSVRADKVNNPVLVITTEK